jgi:hypothetical protein
VTACRLYWSEISNTCWRGGGGGVVLTLINNLLSVKCFGFVSQLQAEYECGMNYEQTSEISFQNSPYAVTFIISLRWTKAAVSVKEESCRQNKWYCANWMGKKLLTLKKLTHIQNISEIVRIGWGKNFLHKKPTHFQNIHTLTLLLCYRNFNKGILY